jgi:phosphotransferase system HPr (HPr) family protein
VSASQSENGKHVDCVHARVAAKQGLHMRLAHVISAYVQEHSGRVRVPILNTQTNEGADGSSILGLMSLCVPHGTVCAIAIEADDASSALQVRHGLLSLMYRGQGGENEPIFSHEDCPVSPPKA